MGRRLMGRKEEGQIGREGERKEEEGEEGERWEEYCVGECCSRGKVDRGM